MKFRSLRTWLAIIVCLISFCAFPYEDLTHQRLTDQSIKIAVSKGGVPQSFYDDYATSIIAGAGKPQHGLFDKTAGEDYTYYTIKRKYKKEMGSGL